MGCVEVLQSMRALDFNTRTQVTRSVGGAGEPGVGRLVVVLAWWWCS